MELLKKSLSIRGAWVEYSLIHFEVLHLFSRLVALNIGLCLWGDTFSLLQ